MGTFLSSEAFGPLGREAGAAVTTWIVIALSRDSVRCSPMGSDSTSEDSPERRFRTLFISDVHLGARGSQAERLLDFLRVHDADTIYLVGDIVDGWALRSNW